MLHILELEDLVMGVLVEAELTIYSQQQPGLILWLEW